jgi:hypothetical protein
MLSAAVHAGGINGICASAVLMGYIAACFQVATIYAKQKLKAQRGKPQQKKA